MKTEFLRYKKLWLLIGLMMIVFVITETLTSSPIDTGVEVSDKILHTAGYFVLMGWFVQIFHGRKHQLLLAAGFVSMGIVLEFLQGWGGVRQYEVADMLANASGVALAWLLSLTRFIYALLWFEKVVSRQNTTRN
ncbi:MAG: hypothetical protein QG652_413 [Pseudomonadota bacterium]|nr:hypothetical protein [Pseudomonadota bacterium]